MFDAEAVSPKFHDQPVIDPEEIVVPLRKQVMCPIQAGEKEKSTTGSGFIVTFRCVLFVHPMLFVAVRVTVYVPELAYA